MAPEHRGLLSGRRLHKGDTAWEKGIWFGKSGTDPEHIVGTENGAMGTRRIRRLEPTQPSETSLLVGIHGVPSDLVPNAPRHGRRKRHPTLAPVPPPVHGNPTDDKSSSSCDSTSSSSTTQAQGEIPRHVTVRAQAQNDGGESSCCTCRECVVVSDSDSSCQVVFTDQASS